jgi:biotin operon repressor
MHPSARYIHRESTFIQTQGFASPPQRSERRERKDYRYDTKERIISMTRFNPHPVHVFSLTFALLALNFALYQPAWTSAQEKKSEASSAKGEEWKAVEGAMNRTGEVQPDGVLKFSMPRKDMKVSVAGMDIKPGLALGSWVAFTKMGNHAMVMGDLVLAEDEVSPVMKTLEDGGVEITALHNHVLKESPRVMYMHIGATGDPAKIAQTIRAALDQTKTPGAGAASAQESQDIGIDTKQLDSILGHTGKVKGGLYQLSVPRATAPKMNGMAIPNSMGTSTAINFQPAGGGKAAITGDFVLIGGEVNPVIKALRDNGIEVTAIHSHMLEEQPRLFFMHFWANDDAVKLAKGLRAALDKTASQLSK